MIAPPPVVVPTVQYEGDKEDQPERRDALARGSSQPWPQAFPIRALPSSPDWVADDAYPPEALARESEGQVSFEALIDRRGIPTACRILVPSNYVLLDDGTCDRAMRMRFEPPRDTAGQSVA